MRVKAGGDGGLRDDSRGAKRIRDGLGDEKRARERKRAPKTRLRTKRRSWQAAGGRKRGGNEALLVVVLVQGVIVIM